MYHLSSTVYDNIFYQQTILCAKGSSRMAIAISRNMSEKY